MDYSLIEIQGPFHYPRAMRRLGVHTSIAGGLHLSLERARSLGCTTMQIFSHNPRSWAVSPLPREEAATFRSLRRRFDISPVFVHASYLINISSPDATLRKKSMEFLSFELDRADDIGADYVILHAGGVPPGADARVTLQNTVSALKEVSLGGRWNAGILLENTAGRKGEICGGLHAISEIMNHLPVSFIPGVCIDTCHAFACGYDIRSSSALRTTVSDLSRYIGLDRVKLIHLNDSRGDVGSHLDRHEHIGRGKIGSEGLRLFINYPVLSAVPLILETPKKEEGDDPKNLAKVRKMLKRNKSS